MNLPDILAIYLLGLLTPLTAVCVIPLYPGFIAFLANQATNNSINPKKTMILIGSIVVLGVLTFMSFIGILFSTLLKVSLTKVIGIVSPIAFGLLALISLLLIFNINFSKIFPELKIPKSKNPYLSSFIFGFFFGAIIIPCNPLFIAAFFTKALSTTSFGMSMINFFSFGIGIGTPLLAFSILSASISRTIVKFFTSYKKTINITSGIIMLSISLYELIFIFRIFG